MFNDVFVVSGAPDPYDPMSPYDYMDETGISWSSGERQRSDDLAQPSPATQCSCTLLRIALQATCLHVELEVHKKNRFCQLRLLLNLRFRAKVLVVLNGFA